MAASTENQALAGLIGAAKAKDVNVHLDGARIFNAAAAGFDVVAIRPLGVDILVIGGTESGHAATHRGPGDL